MRPAAAGKGGNMKIHYICFPGGKHKALTLSYDDGRLEDRRLVQIMNENGIRGTFHLNSGIVRPDRIPASEWKELYRGHEIACHTSLHPTISRCPLEQVALQVLEDRRRLERTAGYPVRGLSYPNGSYSGKIRQLLPGLGIEYARTVEETGGFDMPEDFLAWKATCHHKHGLMERAREFVDLYKTQYLYLMYVWGHSYEFGADGNWELMERFCRLTGGRDDIWYATNIEIVDYMKAAWNLKFTVDGDLVYNPSASPVWISVEEDGEKKIVQIGAGQSVAL